MLGSIGNSCTVEDWQMDDKLVRLAERLSEYYQERMEELEYIDEYNEMTYRASGELSGVVDELSWA
jgi:hypothetical protein